MLVTASIALLGVSLGGISATFNPLAVEPVSTLVEETPNTFRFGAEPTCPCWQDVTPLDVDTRTILEHTLGSHSVELLPTECRSRTGTYERDGSTLELGRTEYVARFAGTGRVPAPGIPDTPDRSIASPNGPPDLTRTVLPSCGPFTTSEPYPGGHAGLVSMLIQLDSENHTGCAGAVEAVGGFVVSITGDHPGGHDIHASWGTGPTMLAEQPIEGFSIDCPVCIDSPLSCRLPARQSFIARAGATSTGWCDETSENQFGSVLDSGDHSARHVDDPALFGMSGRIVMSQEDCITTSTSTTSVFREMFSELKERVVAVTRPSGLVILAKQLFLTGCSSLGAACGGDLEYRYQREFGQIPSTVLPRLPIAMMPIRASGDPDGFGSVDGAGLFCSLGRWC